MLLFLIVVAFVAMGASPALNFSVPSPQLTGTSAWHRRTVVRRAMQGTVETEGAVSDPSSGFFVASSFDMVSRAALAFLTVAGLVLMPVEPAHARGLGVSALRKLSKAVAASKTTAILNKISRTALVANYAGHFATKHTSKPEAVVASAAAPGKEQHEMALILADP
mmetsp:Transcript_7172/g.17899  ORF Transcript_7172/g.17899 Transcript_7172/m.17899 type:complete len:166 (+) Transcript_7172:60-557(+)|eukprot:CAMPEP_0115656028 /NCGR_PEP_ID=MMETSP0272-20121206/43945_1 /TAXON_ID=71861 /ORGANISM="Scrippsiella trochoidea, Strain CCMP3099" /LENGTH=165 /DNA_ID=CAMNT_0003093995 /DNA_START=1 /DNA_END=498 /DNA_ORIENTATION=-